MKINFFICLLFLLMTSLQAYSQCNTCGGKGYLEQSISCTSCNYGYAETVITRDCTHCYGASRVSEICDVCHGSRINTKKVTRTCSICGGSSYRKVKTSAGQCSECKGTGNSEGQITSWPSGTRCTKCGGEGVIYVEKETYCTCERGQVSTMDEIAVVMNKYNDLSLTITGHTCSKGYKSVNRRVGLKRANVAKTYLIEKGVEDSRISTSSMGEESPVVDNLPIENRQMNRRLEFVV